MADENPRYISAIHDLPCCVCVMFGLTQTTRTTAHHTIHDRYESRRTHDELAIPLCDCHHQGDHMDCDKTKLAIHRGKKSWFEVYGKDTAYIEQTQAQLKEYMAPVRQKKTRKAKTKKKTQYRPMNAGPKQKIQSRGFGAQKQKIPSRKFGS